MLNVYLAGGTNPTKFLEPPERRRRLPRPTARYAGRHDHRGEDARLERLRTDLAGRRHVDDRPAVGDYRADYPQQTFGPASGSEWTLTHAAVNSNSATAQTASELLLATIALSGTTTVNIGQSFLYTLRWTQQ
jgi:hypothetical protein